MLPAVATGGLSARISFLRNATDVQQTITDEKGNVVFDTGNLGWARKTYGAVTQMGIQYTAMLYTPGWHGQLMKDGVNDAGDWAPDSQWYTYTIKATPVGSNVPQTKEFKFYLDNTRPTVEDIQLYEEDGNVYLSCVVSDNFYVQRIRVIDSTQEYWYLAEADAFDQITETGAKTRVTMDVTELASELASDGKNPGRVGLLLEDVAYNQSLTFVDIGPRSMTLESVNVEVGESKADCRLHQARADGRQQAHLELPGYVCRQGGRKRCGHRCGRRRNHDHCHSSFRPQGLCQGQGGQGRPGAPHLWRGAPAERPVPDGRRLLLEGHWT